MMKTLTMTVLIAVAFAGPALAAQRGSESPTLQRRAAPVMRAPQQLAAKPDLEPLQLWHYAVSYQSPKVWVLAPAPNNANSLAKGRNNGPGTLTASFIWRLRCRVVAKEFDLGPCFYHNISDAQGAQGGFETITVNGPVGTVSVGPGSEFQAQFPKTFMNCREDMHARCHVTLQLDLNGTVAETNEGNNIRGQWF